MKGCWGVFLAGPETGSERLVKARLSRTGLGKDIYRECSSIIKSKLKNPKLGNLKLHVRESVKRVVPYAGHDYLNEPTYRAARTCMATIQVPFFR